MIRKGGAVKTGFKINESVEGETIEAKVRRIMNNNEAISDGAPIIFTERKDGVIAEFDIRSDRFELALDAMDKVHTDHLAKRMERHFPKKDESTQATAEGKAENA